MATDPVVSAMEALRAHLEATIVVPGDIPSDHNTLTVLDGWPEWGTVADAANPLISLTAGNPDVTPVSPVALSHDTGVTVWRTALLEWAVQVDLWVPYKAHLGPMLEALTEALDNLTPASSGLELVQADYHDLTVRFRTVGQAVDQDSDAAPRGTWRARVDLRATCSRVRRVTTPTIQRLDATTTFSGAVEGSETTILVSTS